MNRFCLFTLAAIAAAAPFAAKADTVINLNATIPQNADGGTGNSLASGFYNTSTFGPGTYRVTVIGTGILGTNGVTSVYSGWNFSNSGPGTPTPGDYTERTAFSTGGGSFTNASASNGYQNSYVAGATDTDLFTGNFGSTAAALAAATSYTFTLNMATSVTFYIDDGSYTPGNVRYGFDDNYGGVSLDVSAVAPEPSSLLLMATGALTTAGMIKRRFAA